MMVRYTYNKLMCFYSLVLGPMTPGRSLLHPFKIAHILVTLLFRIMLSSVHNRLLPALKRIEIGLMAIENFISELFILSVFFL